MKHQSHRIRRSVAALAVTVAGGASALGLVSAAAAHAAATSPPYAFTTLDNQKDPTFNQLLGINSHNVIAGSYLDGAGVMHGFTLKSPLGPRSHWQAIDDPNGVGSTVGNGVSNTGDLAGFYTDAVGNTDGMLATP